MEEIGEIKVMIVDKHSFFKAGLRQALSREADLNVLDCEPSRNLATVIEDESPDVLLLDIDYPSLSGLGLSRRIARHFSNTKVVMLTPRPDDEELVKVIESGAVAYSSKNTTVEELVRTIRRAYLGEYPINDIFAVAPQAAEQVLKQFRNMALLQGRTAHRAPLSVREIQVLTCIARGNSNKQIGCILQISDQTVKNHVSSILRKLAANDRAHAVVLAIQGGWIAAEEGLSEWSLPKDRVLLPVNRKR